MSIEHILSRLNPKTAPMTPQEGGDGPGKYTQEDCLLIASAAPHLAFHAIQAKFCGNPHSLRKMYAWAHQVSIEEWFQNPTNKTARIRPGQVNRLVELSVLAWAVPFAPEVATIATRSQFVGAAKETYRTNYQGHYAFLIGELGYLEQIGARAIEDFKRESPDE